MMTPDSTPISHGQTPMNARAHWLVQWACSVVLVGLGACAQGDVTYFEVSWFLRSAEPCDGTTDDYFKCAQCSNARIKYMQLNGPDCLTPDKLCKLPCDQLSGSVASVMEGETVELSLTPICVDPGTFAEPALFTRPDPFEREVTPGDIISLQAFVITVKNTNCDTEECICE